MWSENRHTDGHDSDFESIKFRKSELEISILINNLKNNNSGLVKMIHSKEILFFVLSSHNFPNKNLQRKRENSKFLLLINALIITHD